MRKLFFLLALTFTSIFAEAQSKIDMVFPAVVKFGSECCGVPDSKPILAYVKKFKKQYGKKSIVLYKVSPMGREGEYDLAFPLKELSAKQRSVFIRNLQTIAKNLKGQGYATVEKNLRINSADFSSRTTATKQIL
ncbi:MAG: hypothetical protein JWQ27_2063 [Ferruginibacter sp.]|nr:hypothetical protein [Ferruginibacter sp.]